MSRRYRYAHARAHARVVVRPAPYCPPPVYYPPPTPEQLVWAQTSYLEAREAAARRAPTDGCDDREVSWCEREAARGSAL